MSGTSTDIPIYSTKRLRIWQQGDDLLIIRSSGSLLYASLLFVLVLLGGFAIWLCAAAVYLSIIHNPRPGEQALVVGGGSACGVFFLVSELAFIYLLAQYPLTRRTTFDVRRGLMVSRRIPGIEDSLAIQRIAAVTLLLVHDGKTSSCVLTVSEEDGKSHAFHADGGLASATHYREKMIPAARLIADFLKKPLESSTGQIRWLSWYKAGPSEPIIN